MRPPLRIESGNCGRPTQPVDILYIIAGTVLFAMVIRSNAARKRDREEHSQLLEQLSFRISKLEQLVRTSEQRHEKPAETRSAQGSVEQATPETQPFTTVAAAQPTEPDEKNLPVTTSTERVVQVDDEIAAPTLSEAPTPSVAEPETTPAPPSLRLQGWNSQSTFADRVKKSHDLEERLGTNWLNKLGIGILVLGIAFFLAYELKEFGPAGKVMVGVLPAWCCWARGIWLERKERYRILARAGIGGGWALLFFTAYAMYHVPAAKVLTSEAVDLTIMLAVTMVNGAAHVAVQVAIGDGHCFSAWRF